jgi:hypothetical protein
MFRYELEDGTILNPENDISYWDGEECIAPFYIFECVESGIEIESLYDVPTKHRGLERLHLSRSGIYWGESLSRWYLDYIAEGGHDLDVLLPPSGHHSRIVEPLEAYSLLLDFAARNHIQNFQMPDDMVSFEAALQVDIFNHFVNTPGDSNN